MEFLVQVITIVLWETIHIQKDVNVQKEVSNSHIVRINIVHMFQYDA